MDVERLLARYGARGLFDRLDGIAWIGDTHARVWFVSERATDVLGFGPDAWIADPDLLRERVAREDRPELLACCRAIALDRRDRRLTLRVLDAAGRTRWLRTELHALDLDGLDDRGEPALLGLMLDVTGDHAETDALREDRRRLDAAQRLAKVGVFEWDFEADRAELSEELRRLVGLSPRASSSAATALEELSERIHPDDRVAALRSIRAAIADGRRFDLDFRVEREDGMATLRASGETSRDASGTAVRVLGVARELAACERGDQELARTLALTRAFLDSTPAGLLVLDRSGAIVDYNKALLSLWNVSPDTLGSVERWRRDVSAALRDPAKFFQEQKDRRPDDHISDRLELTDGRVLERTSVPYRLAGEIIGRVSHFCDVTERVRTAAERDRLLERERLARASAVEAEGRASFLAEASRLLVSLDPTSALASVARLAVPRFADWCSVSLVDERGALRRVVTVCDDPAAPPCGDTGWAAPEEAVLRSGRAALRPDAAPGADHRAQGVTSYVAVPVAAGGSRLGVLIFASTRAERRYGSADLALAEDVAGRMALAVENARLHDSLRSALHAREEFLRVASHELLSPLASLRLAVQRLDGGGLRDRKPLDDRTLRLIERQTARLTRLVDDMLHVARQDPLVLELTEIDLVELTREVIARLGPEAVGAGCPIVLHAGDPMIGRWDRAGLARVLESLVANAIRFGKGAPIDVSLSSSDGRARLEIADRGIGISPEVLERIFRRFERGVPWRHYGGLGLGLYLAREVVERLGGTIRARSAPGQGATFVVELPVDPPAGRGRGDKAPPTPPTSPT